MGINDMAEEDEEEEPDVADAPGATLADAPGATLVDMIAH